MQTVCLNNGKPFIVKDTTITMDSIYETYTIMDPLLEGKFFILGTTLQPGWQKRLDEQFTSFLGSYINGELY